MMSTRTGVESRRRSCLRCLSAVVAALMFVNAAPVVHAQADYAKLVVIVRKSAGAQDTAPLPVSRARVTVTGERGSRNECTTDEGGRCEFRALEPDTYTIEAADARGGAAPPQKLRPVRLGSGQRATRRVFLVEPLTEPAESRFKIGPQAVPAAPPPPPVGPEAVPPAPPPPSPVGTPAPLPAPAPPPEVGESEQQLIETITPARRGVNLTAEDTERVPTRGGTPTAIFDTQPGVFSDAGDTFRRLNVNGLEQNVLREGGIETTPIELSTVSFQDTGAFFIDVKERQSFKKYKTFRFDTNNFPAGLGTGTGAALIADVTGGGAAHRGELYEYFAGDTLGARDFFDFASKPDLRFHLFGGKIGGPIVDRGENVFPKLFYFVNYEGIRARSGITVFEAAPRRALRERAAPAVVPLLDSFRAGGATVVAGASSDTNFDILRLDSENVARRDSLTARFDYTHGPRAKLGFLYIGALSRENTPVGVSGRRQDKRDIGHTFGARHELQLLKDEEEKKELKNEFIFGINDTPARLRAVIPAAGGADLTQSAFAIGGEVPHTGIPGVTAARAVATPGGLLAGSDFGGRRQRFRPSSYTFVDQLTWQTKNHTLTLGGEARLVRASIEQLFGTTYNFKTLDDFLANRASVEYRGDLGSFSGAVGDRRVAQQYYIGFVQHAWDLKRTLRLTHGLRYEHYTVPRERNDRAVIFDPETGTLMPPGTPLYRSRGDNVLPRLGLAWAPFAGSTPNDELNLNPTVFSASYGMHVGPESFDNILRPVVSDRLGVTQDGGFFPADTGALAAAFAANPDDRRFKPAAISRDFISPPRVHKFDVTIKRDLLPRDPFGKVEDEDIARELFVVVSYIGNRGRGLRLRNFANRIVEVETNPDPTGAARVRRQFDIERGDQILRPFGEIEYLTTGGKSSYDSLQVSLKGRARKFLRLVQAEYTLARSRGNADADAPIVAGDTFDFDYDQGYNAGDVRHKFSFASLFFVNCTYVKACVDSKRRAVKELLGNWTIAVLGSFQSGAPIDLLLKRPDVVYLDAEGHVFGSPAAGRRAVLNVPGGVSGAAHRPHLIPGVNPYLGGFADRRFLNPAAFATPAPGELGAITRGALRGPGRRLVDLSFRKTIDLDEDYGNINDGKSLAFSIDITNVFNFTNFKTPPATLPDKLGLDATANQLQPGQPFTAEAVGKFGITDRTFKRKQDLGASRLVQFSVALKF